MPGKSPTKREAKKPKANKKTSSTLTSAEPRINVLPPLVGKKEKNK